MPDQYAEGCPVERTLRLLSGKWRLFVLFRLSDAPMRFNALQRSLPPITQRVLTATLRGLEEDGLVWRRSDKAVPPSVEYGLTERGVALMPVWDAMATWSLSDPAFGPMIGHNSKDHAAE
jgi:DNA-binding HxlR family transcriptional regulator